MNEIRSEIDKQVNCAKDGVTNLICDAKELVKEYVPGSLNEAKDCAMDAVHEGASAIKRNPGQSVLAAVAAGFVLALLVGKARGRSLLN